MSEPAKRAPRDDQVARLAALAVVTPVNRRIAHWQATAVRLRAISLRGPDRDPLPLLAQVDALEVEVSRCVNELGSVIDAQPRVFEIDRVKDTLRALATLQSSLGKAREAFDAH